MANATRTEGKTVTASQLRQDIYHMLDEVLRTGVPLVIERRGHRLRIMPADPSSKLDRVAPNEDYIAVDPETLVHLDWSDEWRGEA